MAANAIFCTHCGTKLDYSNPAPGSSAPPTKPLIADVFQQSEYVIEKSLLTRGVRVGTELGFTHVATDTFEIKDKSGSLLAQVTSKGFDSGGGLRTFTVASPTGESLAELRKNVFQLSGLKNMQAAKDKPSYEAFDSTGRLLASIKHTPTKPDSRFSPQVPCIIDAQGQEIARLDYGGFLSKQWTLKTAEGVTIATIHVQNLPRETYTVAIVNSNTEPYMILLPFFGMIPEPPMHTNPQGFMHH